MKKTMFIAFTIAIVCTGASAGNALTDEEKLGRFIFFDTRLSNPPGQSCASCHDPNSGFADPCSSWPVSNGRIPGRFGTRNAPSAAYAAFSPTFYFNTADGLYMGGQFWDGRAATLEEQAKGPFLNPMEMNNTEKGVISAIRRSNYAELFRKVYGKNSLGKDITQAYEYVARAIAAFERSSAVNKFNSKYDYFLKGMISLSDQEMRGLALFNDPAKGNCAACHPIDMVNGVMPVFTDFSFDNLGLPKNPQIEELVGQPVPADLGLGVTVNDPAENGKFKVPTLRNIAATSPYGHNGYFRSLGDIVHFYNTRDVPEAGWPAPEVAENVNVDEMGNLGLTPQEEADIVAFLLTLSDGYPCKQCQK